MKRIKTQKELDTAIEKGEREFEVIAAGTFEISFKSAWLSFSVGAALRSSVLLKALAGSHVVAWESSHVVARGSSHVEAWGSSHVEARESSHVVAWESSHVVARESSHVVARGFVSLALWGTVKAKLAARCHAFVHGANVEVEGGIQTQAVLKTSQDWCDYYGVDVDADGLATVYKGVRADYGSFHDSGFKWLPGTSPKAPQFDEHECSHGLHFSPTPRHTLTHHTAEKFLACKIRIADMLVFFEGDYPHKCKAPEVAAPVWEVDIDGKVIEPVKEAA
jgi:hypothetical protein